MSVKNKVKIAIGTGGLAASSIAAWFLLGGESSFQEEREEKYYQTKLIRFREISQRVNSSLSGQDLVLEDPEDGFWDQRFWNFYRLQWNTEDTKLIPQEARTNVEAMRDWCYETIGKNENDVAIGSELLNELSGDSLENNKKFWDNCLNSISKK